jgi:outer membrane lipoprotein SlyB
MKTTLNSKRNSKLTLSLLIPILALSACATHRPIIDTYNRNNPGHYEQDLAECQSIASNNTDTVGSAATGAVAGALFGALLGAAIGGRSGAGFGAKIFGVEGAAGGAVASGGTQIRVINNCMIGRGYNVL